MAIFPLAPDQTIAQMWSNGLNKFRLVANTDKRKLEDMAAEFTHLSISFLYGHLLDSKLQILQFSKQTHNTTYIWSSDHTITDQSLHQNWYMWQ